MSISNQTQKILILAAIPHGLRLDKEIREIESAIRRAVRRDLYEIRIRNAVRTQDIRRALAEERPQIVHFCGHGMEDGSLLLEDEAGHPKPVQSEGLVALFKLHIDYVKCVLLNACHSEKTAKAINHHINYVIGMNQAITDQAAIAFSQGFYDALGYDIQEIKDLFLRAFEEGIVAIQLENLSEKKTPVFQSKFNQDKKKQQEKDRWSIENSVDFFASRFAKSFPGVRGLRLFESPTEAVQRLAKLLEEPLVFHKDTPIWWWRGTRNLHISNFKVLENDTILLNKIDEQKINIIAAFNSGRDYQCFVYVETKPMKAIGLYPYTKEYIQQVQKNWGYYREEFAIYKGKHFITRTEYDDRACMIDGNLIDLECSETELRNRYLTPYNFIISAFHSPINNLSFDCISEEIMNKILEGTSSIEMLVEAITALPKRQLW